MRGKQAGRLRIAAIVLLACLVMCCLAVVMISLALNKPASHAERIQEYQDRLAESNTVWQELDVLWARIEAGDTVRCSADLLPRPYFIVIPGNDIRQSELDNIAHQLNFAIRQLHTVADHWAEVCRGDRSTIAPQLVGDVRAILDDSVQGLQYVASALRWHVSALTEDAAPGLQE